MTVFPDNCYGHIVDSEQDVSCDGPDCLYEPPIVFDRDNADEYKQYKESFEYSLSHNCFPKTFYGNIIADEQDVSCDDADCLRNPPIIVDRDAEAAYKQWQESFEYFIKNGSAH